MLFVFVLCLFAERTAQALTIEEVRELSRLADPTPLQTSIDELEKRAANGTATTRERTEPFEAFYTSDPAVAEFVRNWREMYPDSAYPLIAEAAMKLHQGYVLRGFQRFDQVPESGRIKMDEYYRASAEALVLAMKIDPENLFGAKLLSIVASYTGPQEAVAYANSIIAANRDPEDLFWLRLYSLANDERPRRGAIDAFCKRDRLEFAHISFEECAAYADVVAAGRYPVHPDPSLDVLIRENPIRHKDLIVQYLSTFARHDIILEIFDKHGIWPNYNQIESFNMSNEKMIEYSRKWLDVNPNHPIHLAHLSRGLYEQGKIDEAKDAIERALKNGRTIPHVRIRQLFVAWKDPEMRDRLPEIMLEALDDTNWHYDLYFQIVYVMQNLDDNVKYLSNGAPRENLNCDRHFILKALPNVCAAWNHKNWYCTRPEQAKIASLVESIDTSGCAN